MTRRQGGAARVKEMSQANMNDVYREKKVRVWD
jgi:hypothetical protein